MAAKTSPGPQATLTDAEARSFMLWHLGLRCDAPRDVAALLAQRRCIQLDPLDRIGNSADLWAAARMTGTRRGDTYDALLPGGCFEHMFKVRCLLPPAFLPHYRARMRETGWFGYGRMCERPDEAQLAEVMAEVRERGPSLQSELGDRGMAVKRYDHPWARKATVNMICVDLLEARGDLVVVERTGKGKRYDLAERAFPDLELDAAVEPWARFVVRERAHAAGFLPMNAGPWWTLAKDVRVQVRTDAALRRDVTEVRLGKRRYLAPTAALDRWRSDPAGLDERDDGRMRVLSPLDPLLWDRDLVRHLWDFDYVWEVYKPAAKRRWGYYVCPLLHRGRLVGRFEAHREARSATDGEEGWRVVVDQVWPEQGFEQAAFDACVARLEASQ